MIGGDVQINLGGERDRVQVQNTTIAGDADLRLAGGNDAISIFDSTAAQWTATMAGGDDVLVFFHTAGDMDVKMGSGSDAVWGACGAIGDASFNLGSGAMDVAIFENDFLASMSLVGGGGADGVFFNGATINGPVTIQLGEGAISSPWIARPSSYRAEL